MHIRSWKKKKQSFAKTQRAEKRMSGMQNEIAQQTGNQERIRTELQSKNAALKEASVGYTQQPEITAMVQEALSKRSSGAVRAQKNAEIEVLCERSRSRQKSCPGQETPISCSIPPADFPARRNPMRVMSSCFPSMRQILSPSIGQSLKNNAISFTAACGRM